MTDEAEVELLRRLRPQVTGPDSAFVARERSALMAHIVRTAPELPTTPVAQAPRRRPRWFLPVVVLASATTAAAGWAVLRPDPKTSTAVACGDSIIASSTGDPVADCSVLWRRENGSEPPPLVAYLGPGGGVHVLPAAQEPPEGFSALAPSFRQEAAIIELRAELADVSRGLPSACFGETEARELVEAQLRRLGLADWSITTRPAEQPPARACATGGPNYATAALDPGHKRVLLIPNLGAPPPQDLPFMKLSRWLTEEFVEGPRRRCVAVDEALDLARKQATQLGLREEAGHIVFTIVPSAEAAGPTCARPTTVVGGTTKVAIRAVAR
jgi:hypothetical protein